MIGYSAKVICYLGFSSRSQIDTWLADGFVGTGILVPSR